MAKNENNSHAFIRKMVENIKQTKDAQAPTDPKTNEVQVASANISYHVPFTYRTHASRLPFTETLHSV